MSANDQLEILWSHVTSHLRASVSPDAYTRWFSSLKLSAAGDDAVRIFVPDSIHQLWIEMNYLPVLQAAFGAVTGMKHLFHLEINPALAGGSAAPPGHGSNGNSSGVNGNGHAPRHALPADRTGGHLHLSPVNGTEDETTAAAAKTALPVPVPPEEPFFPGEAERTPVEGLSPALTFDSFVVGASNQFAHAAALAVAQKPGRSYNPLFFYGGSGLGKTHLMHAIGTAVRDKKPRARIVYVTSEEFTNLFIQALQTHSITRFRKRFRQADVLLIDDIHFLAGKERSQEEFFHTFNALLDGHKQIVLSSDRPPGEIKDLENRLVTRFEWGHTTELTQPDEETRVAILLKKAESLEVDVPVPILEFIASKISSSIRRLQGALIRVASWISLHGPMSFEAAEELLRDLLAQEARNVMTIDRVQKGVAESYDIRIADMTSRKRPAAIVFPRQVAMFLARELTGSSYQELGNAFGGRDHGTIMHACRTVEQRMKRDEQIRLRVKAIETQLRRMA